MVAKKLQCRVPAKMDAVITRLHVKNGGKGKALNELLKRALRDKAEFVSKAAYGTDDTVSCTLTVGDNVYDDTEPYRQRYSLTTATTFFRRALEHGATLYEAEVKPTAEQVPEPPKA